LLRRRIERNDRGENQGSSGDPNQNAAGRCQLSQHDRQSEKGDSDEDDRRSDGERGRQPGLAEAADRALHRIVSRSYQPSDQNHWH
jgi:hypothetical protein